MLKPLDRWPGADRRQRRAARARLVAVAEQIDLLALALVGGGGGMAQQQVASGEGLRAVAAERVERAGLGQAFELAPDVFEERYRVIAEFVQVLD